MRAHLTAPCGICNWKCVNLRGLHLAYELHRLDPSSNIPAHKMQPIKLLGGSSTTHLRVPHHALVRLGWACTLDRPLKDFRTCTRV